MKPSEFDKLRQSLYTYRFRVSRVIDGDTVEGRLDLGCHVEQTVRLRLLGINAPELKGTTNVAGIAARGYLGNLLAKYGDSTPAGYEVIAQTSLDKADKYGRLLATIFGRDAAGDLVNFNERMVHDGQAVPAPESWQ